MAEDNKKLTEKQQRRLYWAVWAFLILGIVGTLWHGFNAYVWRLNHGYHKAQPSLPPESGFVKYEIGGYKFQIPIAYHYTIYEMRGNRWIEGDHPVYKVKGGMVFDVFLPDFKSIGLDAFSVPKIYREKHIRVAMTTSIGGYPIEKVIERRKQSKWYQDLSSYPNGLWGSYDIGNKQTYYFQSDRKDNYFSMICKVRCSVEVTYKQYPTLRLSYSFNKENLQDWSRINDGIRQKLNEFRVSQFN